MKIAISGSSGFVGTHIKSFSAERNVTVVPLGRNHFNTEDTSILENALSGCEVVINLAGATINHRWTEKYKKEIMNSRINTTRRLVEAINGMDNKPRTFVSVSAVGIYPSEGVYTEKQPEYGTGFLSRVCIRWEQEAKKISSGVRLVIPRFGVVLANDGGALPAMLLPFKLFAGGRIGNGKQGFSWIHIDDLLEALFFLVQNQGLNGVFNFTAPQLLTNRDFARIAAHELHRPDWFTVPAFVFHVLYGQGHVIATEGQQAYPEHLLEAGYKFRYPDLEQALHNI